MGSDGPNSPGCSAPISCLRPLQETGARLHPPLQLAQQACPGEQDCSHRPSCWSGDGRDTVLGKKPCTVPASPTQSRAENQPGCRSSCSAHPSTGAVRRPNHGETCQQPRSHLLPEASPQSPGLGPAPGTHYKSLVEEDPSERVPIPEAESGHWPHSWPHTCPQLPPTDQKPLTLVLGAGGQMGAGWNRQGHLHRQKEP